MRRHYTSLIFAALLLSGCASRITLQVDSITDTEVSPGGTYILKSGMRNIREDDLYFREFSGYFHQALAAKGFQQTTDPAQAEMIILFSYDISRGRTTRHIYTTPVYDVVGGYSINYEETKSDSSGTTTTSGKNYLPLRHRQIGRNVHISKQTTYTGYAALEARRPGGNHKIPPLWKTSVQGASDSNDLRGLMPILATAAAPYLAADTGKSIKIHLTENDQRVRDMRSKSLSNSGE